MKKIWKIESLKYVIAFLVPMIFLLFLNQRLDNDSWYVLAEGRQIVESGVYYTDELSMHEGLNVTVQNYGYAAIFYLVHSVFGAPGLYIMTILLFFLVCFLLYKICMTISNKNTNLSLFIMMITGTLMTYAYVTTRAQMVSYVLFLGLIYILELYIKTDKSKYLWWLPVLGLLQINLHASLFLMLVLVWLVYMVDSIKKPRLHLQGYRTKPLLIAGVAMLLCGFINPYGAKMITFILSSYSNGNIQNLVSEMMPYTPFRNVFNALLYLAFALAIMMYAFGDKKNIRMRYLLMFVGFFALGINTNKGMSQFALTLLFPMALLYKDVKIGKILGLNRLGRNALLTWTSALFAMIFVVFCPYVLNTLWDYPNVASIEAIDSIDADSLDRNKEELTVFTGYNDGGYTEYRGYKSYLDPRAEVFIKSNNGKEDILKEYLDYRNRKIETKEFLNKYNFDYIWVVGGYEPLYELQDEKYKVLYENEEEEMKVFKRMD